jgi:hypothetical protein
MGIRRGEAVYILILHESVAATGRRFSGAQSNEIKMDPENF